MALSVTNLSGFGVKRAAAGAATISFTFVAESSTTSAYTLALPTGAAAGDLLIVAEGFDGTSNISTRGSPPTIDGAMTVFDDGVNTDTFWYIGTSYDIQRGVYRRVLTSADITNGTITSSITTGANTNTTIVAQCWRPDSSITTITDENTHGDNGVFSDPASQTIDGSGGTVTMINVAAVFNDTQGSTGITFDRTTVAGSGVGQISLGVQFEYTTPFSWTLDNGGASSTEVSLMGAAANIA